MKSILIPSIVFDDITASLTGTPLQVELLRYDENETPVDGATHADAVFRWIAGKRFSTLVDQGTSIRWLHTASAGVDHVLTPAVKGRKGIVVTDSGPAFGPAIAEFVLASMLSFARRLPELSSNQTAHRWQHVDQRELMGATIGIIGLGPIGQAIAERAKAFGMKTIGLRRSQKPAEFVDEITIGADGLGRTSAEADYVVLAAALTGETNHLIGAEQLAMMKPDALLINIARGGIVDEAALINALTNGRIGGAVLDVFSKEPLPTESPLWEMPNVFISPHHSGGGSPGLRQRQIDIFLDNLRRYCNGDQLLNQVDIDRGY